MLGPESVGVGVVGEFSEEGGWLLGWLCYAGALRGHMYVLWICVFCMYACVSLLLCALVVVAAAAAAAVARP